MGYYGYGGGWPEYVPVAERKQKAAKKIKQLIKKGKSIDPITIEGRTIVKTYWGKAWCKNLESYSDYANRIPRGRSYVRHGAVIDLKISAGSVKALVYGSSVYKVTIDITTLAKDKWQKIVRESSGKIDSIIELLKGKFSKSVMEVIACKDHGLFPHPDEIKIDCSCPDYAGVCKHVAAVFYGIGVRFDENPELLFTLRQVDHNELIVTDGALEALVKRDREQLKKTFDSDELSNIFGVDIDVGSTNKKKRTAKKTTQPKKTSKAKTIATKKIKKKQETQKTKKEKKCKKPVKATKPTKRKDSLSKSKSQKRIKSLNAGKKKKKTS